MPISKLVWHREDVPDELHGMLDTLGGEFPISEGGRGLRLRFRKVAFAPVDADALRLIVTEAWGGEGERAHVFAFDAL